VPNFVKLIFFCLTTGAWGQSAGPECFVELPVFDPLGNKVPFEIVAVQADEGGSNLLTTGDERSRGVVEADRLFFPRAWLYNGLLHVTLKAKDAADLKKALNLTRVKGDLTLKRAIELNTCEQRTSLRIGIRDTESDVNGARIDGRISGCQLDKDWWVRAMPMFGGQDAFSIYEGFIRVPDGSFSIAAPMLGERHILIIGRAKDPLLAIGVDVMSGGGKTNVGVLDLDKTCPK
jgi:hypothetical protein